MIIQVAVAQHLWLVAVHIDGHVSWRHFGQNKANT
jgi:hypothetical protein